MAPRELECDDAILNPAIKHHIAHFYEAADTQDHEHWASFFAEGATLKKGASVSHGLAEILSARTKSWKSGQTKEHIVFKAFPLGNQSLEVMLRGLSKWHYEDGTHAEANWAAYMGYVRVGETVKLMDYEIYMPLPPK